MCNLLLALRRRLPAMVIGLVWSLAVPASAATVSWINPAGGNWSVAANWSSGTLPAATDDILITMAGTYSVNLDVSITITSLTLGGTTGEQTLTNSGQTLSLADASIVEARGVLAVNGGTLAGTGLLTVNGLLRLTGGALYGAVNVATGGMLEMAGPTDLFLVGTVVNQGQINWSGPNNVVMAGNGRLENLPGGTMEIQNDQGILCNSGSPALVNAGLLRKTAGTGTTTLGIALANTGTVEVQAGVVVYTAGSMFGTGSSFTGAGTNLLAGGTSTLDGAIYSENLEIGGAVVAGTNTISGTLTWTREWIGGAAVMTIAPNGTLRLVGAANKGLAGTLNNQGHVIWSGDGQWWMSAGQINNQAGGVFEIQSDSLMLVVAGAATLSNAGRIWKTGGTGRTTFGLPLFNSGSVQVDTGTVAHAGSSVMGAGSTFLGAGTNLLASGVITLDGAIHSENLEIGGAIVAGTSTISGTLAWTREWIGGAAVMTIATNGTLRLIGPADKGLAGTLNNLGHVVWSDSGQIAMGGGTLNNLPGGLFEIQNDRALYYYSATNLFNNAGWMRKSAGTGVTTLGVVFSNTGTVDVQTGIVGFTTTSTLGAGSSFLGAGTNLLASGGVTLDGAIHSENLEIGGATVAGTNTISGTVTWTRQWIGGAAVMTIATNGTLRLIGPDDKGLAGTLNNLGHVVWSDGGQIAMGGGTLNNLPGGLFEIQNDRAVYYWSGTNLFNNAGWMRKSVGTGVTTLGVTYSNTGTVEVQTGIVSFATAGILGAGSTFLGAGTNLLGNGVITLDGAIHSENLQLGGATVVGTNTISGTLTWTSGWVGGGAAMTIATNATLNITSPTDKGLDATLLNLGRVVWSGAGNLYLANARIDNQAGGTFEIWNDQALVYHSSSPVFANAGFFRKLGGSGATIVQNIAFDNTGTVDVQSGTVLFACVYTQTAGRLNLGLNSLTNFGRVQFAGTAPLTGTLGANLNAGYRPRAGDAFAVVTYPARTSAFVDFDLPSVAAWQTNDTIYSTTDVTLTVLNARPVLAAIGDHSLNEETALNVPSTVDHPDLNQTVTYSLTQTPTGAQIDSATGVLTWTPTEAQGPGTNTVTLQVTDNGTPPLSDSRTFTVTVREVNHPPQWTAPASVASDELVLLQVPTVATDPDLPTNTLSFILLSGPIGADIDPNSGRFTWTPAESQGPGSYTLTVKVSDNGEPSLSITNQLDVTVREVNTPPTLTVPDAQALDELATLTVTNTARDADLPANTLTFSLVSAPANVQLNPATGVITWTPTEAQGPTNATIRVRVTDNGTPPQSDTRDFTVAVHEVNLPPVLAAIPAQTIVEGFSLGFTNVVTDPDLPANTLTFSLVAPPAAFAIDPVRGILTWTPSPGQVPSTNRITVRVTDNGVPARTDEQSFAAAVVPVPSLRIATDGEGVRICWPGAAPGFVLQRAPDLQPPIDWKGVANAVGQIGDDRVVTNRTADSPQFFRLVRP